MQVSRRIINELQGVHGVYVLSRNGRSPFKVGFSRNMDRRLSDFRSYAVDDIYIHAAIAYLPIHASSADFAKNTEKKLHALLEKEDDRIYFHDGNKTEWFTTVSAPASFVQKVVRYALDYATPSPERVWVYNSRGRELVHTGKDHTVSMTGRKSYTRGGPYLEERARDKLYVAQLKKKYGKDWRDHLKNKRLPTDLSYAHQLRIKHQLGEELSAEARRLIM